MGMSPKANEFLWGQQQHTIDPNNPMLRGLQQDQTNFLQQLFQNPQQGFQQLTSPLQQQAANQMGQFLNQPAPETRALDAASPMLQNIIDGTGGQDLAEAAVPQFQRNLADAQGHLNASGAGRFGTAFEAQGRDLASQALQDFNLFQNQARMQGQQNQMGAAQILGTLSGQAGMNPWQRMMGAGDMGAQMMNPIFQLMGQGLNWAQPMGMNTHLDNSRMQNFGSFLSAFLPFAAGPSGGGGG